MLAEGAETLGMISKPPPPLSPTQLLGESLAHLERAHHLLLSLPSAEGAALSSARMKIMEATALVQERRKQLPGGSMPAVVTK